jgi:tetratricopeptide (TPR) repeat protein
MHGLLHRMLWVPGSNPDGRDCFVPLPVVVAMSEVLEIVGDYPRALELLARCEEQMPGRESAENARLYLVQGRMLWLKNDYEKSLEKYRMVLEAAQRCGRPDDEAGARQGMAMVYNDTGRATQALAELDRALELRQMTGPPQSLAAIYNAMGYSYINLTDFERALDCYHWSLAIHRESGDFRGVAIVLNNIGLIHWSRGERTAAADYFRRCLEVFAKIGERPNVAVTLNNLGGVSHEMGDDRTALKYHRLSLEESQIIGNQRGMGNSYQNMGIIFEENGDLDSADHHFRRALDIFTSLNDPQGRGSVLNSLGIVVHKRFEYDRARALFQESLELKQGTGNRYSEASTLFNLGNLDFDQGNFGLAIEGLGKALAIYQDIGDRRNSGEVQYLIAQILFFQGEYQESARMMRSSIEGYGEDPAMGDAPAWLALAEARLGHWEAALETLYRHRQHLIANDGNRFRLYLAMAAVLGADEGTKDDPKVLEINLAAGAATSEDYYAQAGELQARSGEVRMLLDLLCERAIYLRSKGMADESRQEITRAKETASRLGLEKYFNYINKL